VFAISFAGAQEAPVGTRDAQPRIRAHHSLVYDESRGTVLLAGGSTPLDGGQRFEFFNDLWEFDGAAWRELARGGQGYSGMSLAYDPGAHRVLSFGAYDRRSRGLFRRLEGTSWQLIADDTLRPTTEAGFVFDRRRGRFVTFGGSARPRRPLGDTREYDGASWTTVAGDGPPARMAHVMVYDERRGRTVVFGGMGASTEGPPPLLSDTWEYDGTRWTRVNVTGPAARASAGATYDAKRGMVILFGGSLAEGFAGDTWGFDGRTWTKLADTGPEARAMGYLAYDKRRERVVMFGGRKGWPDGDLNDTWEWDGTHWRRIAPR
jgi:hypothetical protein